MNLILLFEEDFSQEGQRVVLRGRRQAHVQSIHRAKLGDELKVGKINGLIGTGRAVRLTAEELEMEVCLKTQPPKALGATLVLALPRPIMLKRILFHASSLGVKNIYLINSARVEKSFWKSHSLSEDAIREQFILGLEQACDTILPEIFLRPYFKPFVEDELPGIAEGAQGVVAHPQAETACPQFFEPPAVLVVGPEGGFIPYEIEKFQALGFGTVHLGERILRVETAIPVLLSKFLS